MAKLVVHVEELANFFDEVSFTDLPFALDKYQGILIFLVKEVEDGVQNQLSADELLLIVNHSD